MAVDTPARIAVLGAGPIGLETALYGRFLGYDVDIYERGRVAERVRGWAHVKMLSPFAWNASPLGVSALKAQEPTWNIPAADALLTGQEFLERYLLPLATSDLLEDGLRENTEVVGIAKTDSPRGVLFGDEERGDENFRLLLRGVDGREHYAEADVVVDCSGLAHPQHLGPAGLPALGEREHAAIIDYGYPDLTGADRARYGDQRVLVVGTSPGAAKHIAELAKMMERYSATKVTWLTRSTHDGAAPLEVKADHPLAEATRLATLANDAVASGRVTWIAGATVRSIQTNPEGGVTVSTSGDVETEFTVDRILANVGMRPEMSLLDELHVEVCPDTQAPRHEGLITAEPNFYVLGAKSFGRKPGFLLLEGIRQVREMFKIIGDRETLDLYQTVGGVKL